LVLEHDHDHAMKRIVLALTSHPTQSFRLAARDLSGAATTTSSLMTVSAHGSITRKG
jgi:hypothetical protein